MIHCDCGRALRSPREARELLGISGATLNRYREDGWIDPQWHSVGYVYKEQELGDLEKEIYRRNKNVKEVVTQDDTTTN